jgi:leader peptidase (prepilin peptidase)/N-methyltransferase
LFIVLLVIDLEHNILPNKIVYTGMVIALVVAVVAEFVLPVPQLGIKSAAIGGAIGFGLLLLPALISRGGMGWGDIKLAGLIGLVTGFPLIFLAMFLAITSGGLTAAILLLLKIKSRKDMIPFGPFLSLATLATLFWGNDLLSWLNLS